jgi:hypothetical protein
MENPVINNNSLPLFGGLNSGPPIHEKEVVTTQVQIMKYNYIYKLNIMKAWNKR